MSRPDGAERPNILLVVADQLRADHLGFGGDDTVNTPNLDALAERGTVFDEAHVASPTCMPNRASLLAGRWPSAHGTRCNGIPLDPDTSTFVRQLAESGYTTAAVGKMHHQNMGWEFEPDQIEQIRETSPLLADEAAPDAVVRERTPGWDRHEDRARHDAEYLPLPDDYYGYGEVDLVIGHGDSPGGHWRHWARERGVDPALGGPAASTRCSDAWEQVYTSAIPASAHPTEYVGERAEARVRAAAEDEDPFFLFVSFPDPHHPFAPPAEYADRHRPEDVRMPVGFDQDHARSPEHIRRMAARRGTPDPDPTMTFAVDEQQYREALAAQYGLIEFIDDQIGRLLRALEETGQAENTLIVFTADHGDLFGDHGLMLKHFVHYRAVTRVPLVVAGPGVAAGRAAELVSTADLAPTFIELSGARAFRGIQGRSLAPLLGRDDDGAAAVHPWREALLVEEEQPFSPEGLPAPITIRTVLTPRGRMTRYFGSLEVEVYDHGADPDELVNVAADPEAAGLRSHLEGAMLEVMASVAETGIAPTASA
ncbi:sulfatase family protein [Zhihengliuella halotolerans]|uniref:Arylsulfatase A-like enzyme n=1 Tax=Zhihengliuella halotolerans TaxID=370736 RepID=A0A4V2GA37_9MICC|nr:sulfatase-like hydrolase/transferase [Zhihengliuella halotolerans]RZU62706.1 arylsulfatase A-like enzyme [Zhihengliuella halotolerans]